MEGMGCMILPHCICLFVCLIGCDDCGPTLLCHLASLRESWFFERPACVWFWKAWMCTFPIVSKKTKQGTCPIKIFWKNIPLNTLPRTPRRPRCGILGRVFGVFVSKCFEKYVVVLNHWKYAHACFSKAHICKLFKEPGFPNGRKMANYWPTPLCFPFILSRASLLMPLSFRNPLQTSAGLRSLRQHAIWRILGLPTCENDSARPQGPIV